MARKDIIHDQVKNALINDGWEITHDPLQISFGTQRAYVDLGAQKFFAAQKGTEKIAVEVKSFRGRSLISELEKALGQYLIYRTWLAEQEPDRSVYLAIDSEAYVALFEDISGRILIDTYQLKLIIIHTNREEIRRWIT